MNLATIERKKKFLITMIIIMGCATMINYGLFSILSTYLKTTDHDDNLYGGIQANMISVLIIIGIVTVIMVVLIPKENVKEVISRIENPESSPQQIIGDKDGVNSIDNNTAVVLQEEEEEYRTPEQQLHDMVDEKLDYDDDDDKK